MPGIGERWRLFRRPAIINVNIASDASTQVLNMTAQQLYQTQDNLQAVVNFLANSIAQLPLKCYVRDGETQRRRDRDSDAARLLWRPNADQTEFEFIRALAVEYFVYGNVYVWILPDVESDSGYQLRILPTDWIVGSESGSTYAPDVIRVCNKNGGTAVNVPRTEFVQFKMYSAGNPGGFISPISALRQTLQEQIEAGRFRKELWRSSGRLNAQILRPATVAPWDDEARKRFAKAFRESWSAGGSKAGSIPIMEDGMEIKPFQTSFKESEWAESVKLSREAVAAAYGINPSLVWHSQTQTYASAKDNARALYAECLGPVIQMFQQRINTFLLPKVGADRAMYVEFDLTEKLKGSFEERASILQSAVGGPWLTRDEARADLNLPPLPDGEGEQIITPMNVTVGGQASPQDTQGDAYDYPLPVGRPSEDEKGIKLEKKCDCKECKTSEFRIKGVSKKEDDELIQTMLEKFFNRQAKSVISRIGAHSEDFWDADRWNEELAQDLEPLLTQIADEHGQEAADLLDWTYSPELTRAYLQACAEARAGNINEQTRRRLMLELEEEDPDVQSIFDARVSNAEVLGRSAATYISSWAVREAAHQAESAGAPSVIGKVLMKQWITGINPRPSHAAMNGEMVPIDADFSNGQYWPGEDTGDPDESCGCNCSTEVIIT